MTLTYRIFTGFIFKHTGVNRESEGYGILDKRRHRSLIIKGAIYAVAVALIAILKCVKVFLDEAVTPIFTQTGMIESSGAPWLLWVTVLMAAALTLYAVFYTRELAGEVEFKYDTEEESARRGRFE